MRIRDFNRAFRKGFQSYDTWMGDWWHHQSTNPPHRRAYRKISEYMHTFLLQAARHEPDFIVDYACGNGAVLKALVHRFPETRFIALDGSKKMLNIAHHYLDGDSGFVPKEKAFHRDGPRIRLVHSPLPDFSLPAGKADAVLFLFPNMNFSAAEKKRLANDVYSDRTAVSIAKMLSLIPEDDELLTRQRSRELFENMLFDRAISLNIHGMLKPKAHWFKVEYSNVRREGLSKLDTVQTLFSESAWDVKIDGIKIRDRFQLVDSKYYRSSVVLDVYDQSQDPIDRTGGYFISSFRKR